MAKQSKAGSLTASGVSTRVKVKVPTDPLPKESPPQEPAPVPEAKKAPAPSPKAKPKGAPAAAPKGAAVQYSHSSNLPEILAKNKFAILVSTYQAQRILLFSPSNNEGKLNMLMRVFGRPTGIAYRPGELAVCARNQVILFRHAGEVRDESGNVMPHDLILTPRVSFYTGDLAMHEAAYIGEHIVFVNTRFSCIARPAVQNSFEAVWKPDFITELLPDDRCHLNGMAIENGQLRYVTALGATDTPEGWRKNRASGGIVYDAVANKVAIEGLAMPHSPRMHQGKLWFLESGRGELKCYDPADGSQKVVAALPGYLRGLAIAGEVAFVGTCKIREKSTFGGMPIEEKISELKCSIQMVNLASGEVVGMIEFAKGIEELFDIVLIPQVSAPQIFGFEDGTMDGLFVVS